MQHEDVLAYEYRRVPSDRPTVSCLPMFGFEPIDPAAQWWDSNGGCQSLQCSFCGRTIDTVHAGNCSSHAEAYIDRAVKARECCVSVAVKY